MSKQQDLRASRGPLLDASDALAGMQSKYGQETYKSTQLDTSIYGLTGTITTVGVTSLLLVSERMDEDLAYQITKVLFAKKAELAKVHPEAKKLDAKIGREVAPVQLHPGAQRYYTEMG